MKKHFFAFMRVFISIALILLLLYIMRDKYGEIIASLKSTDPTVFTAGFLVFSAALGLASFRLKLIIQAQDLAITFPEAVSLTFIGYFFNNFLPTTIGGDVMKGYYLAKTTHHKVGAYASIFVDRVIGLVTMVFMAFAALIFAGSKVIDPSLRTVIYAITALCATGIIIMLSKGFAKVFSFLFVLFKPFKEKIKKIYDAVQHYKKHTGLIAQSFVISVVSQLLFFVSLGLLALSLGAQLSFFAILLRMPIISFVSLLPSINGLGLREGSTVLCFAPIIGKEDAFAVSLLWLLVLCITSIIGGIIYGVSPQFRTRLKEAGHDR